MYELVRSIQGRGAAKLALVCGALACSVACYEVVEGDRAATGDCPKGEDCSERTPAGLRFIGEAFYDNAVARLGPIAVGGTFELGVGRAVGDEDRDMARFRVEVEDPEVFDAQTTEPSDVLQSFDAEDALELSGLRAGETVLRIVDPINGELMDRLRFSVFEVDSIEIVNAHDSTRDYIVAGCDEALGIHIMGRSGDTTVRLFDQQLDVRTESMVRPDPGMWDCFLVNATVPGTLNLEVFASGETNIMPFDVLTLDEAGLDACP